MARERERERVLFWDADETQLAPGQRDYFEVAG